MTKDGLMELFRLAKQDYQLAVDDNKKERLLDEMARICRTGCAMYGAGFYDDLRAAGLVD